MKKITPEYLSQQRQKISKKIERLKWLHLKNLSSDMLFHGTPGEVYRKCGKPNCKCVEGGTNRHGPYSIIRIFRDGKNTQITVIEEDQELLKMAERYQEQVKIRKEIEVVNKELSFIIDEVTQKRLLKDYKKA